jgi:hypothetical protein
MSEEKALVPVEGKTVDFYGDELQGVVVTATPSEEIIYVPIRPLCDYLGVDWSAQRRRVMRDPVLADEAETVEINTAGGPQAMLCIPLEYLNGWLFGINANRVKDEIKEKLIVYQRECYKVLAAAFIEYVPLSPAGRDSMQALQRIEENALAVAHLAREQMELVKRIDKAAVVVGQHGRRITALEQRLAPPNAITDEQAEEVKAKVHAVAMFLTEHDPSRNHFQGIFNELHRRFGASSYRNIRQSQFHPVMNWLDDWARAGGG